MKIYCARVFTQEELQWIAQLIENNQQQRRTALSRQVCEHLNWRRPDPRWPLHIPPLLANQIPPDRTGELSIV